MNHSTTKPTGKRRREASARPGGSERRARIASAMDACIRKRGYAQSTLTDIATAAGMSPSHVHYYFDGKAAVLEYHFRELLDSLLDDVQPLESKPPLEQIDELVRFFFENPKTGREAAGVYFEIFGVAVHNERIREIKRRWDDEIREFLVCLFEATPRAPGVSAERAADVAFGLLIGLSTNAFFDEDRSRARAKEIFRSELLRLAGAASLSTPLEDMS